MSRRRPGGAAIWLAAGALGAAVFAAYAATLGHDFVDLDDSAYVVENERVRAGLRPAGVWWAFSGLRCDNYQPLTLLSHMADCSMFGLDARGHHATSLLLHAVNTILLFLTLRVATQRTGAACAAACLYGLHPLRVEAVAWVASRKDVLSGLLFLAALLAYTLFARRRDGRAEGNPWLWYAAAVGLHGAALLAKPTAVTFPCVLVLYDIWPLGRMDGGAAGRRWPDLLREKAPFFALSIVHAGLTLAAQRNALASLEALPPAHRAANAVVFLAWQAWASLCPVGLAPAYPYPREGYPAAVVAASAAALAAVTALCVALRRTSPAALMGWLWFAGMLVPVLGLCQAGDQGVADRWTYLPGIGLAIALVFPAADAVAGRGGAGAARIAGGLATSCLGVALAAATAGQAAHWRDAESLWRRAVACHPRSIKAVMNLGWALRERGHDEEAIGCFAAGLDLNPRHPDCANALGLLLAKGGRLPEAEAAFRLAIAARPDLAAPRSNLGMALATMGRFAEAETQFLDAERLAPADPGPRYNHAVLLEQRGDLAAARRLFADVLRLDPTHDAATRRLRSLDPPRP